MWHAHACPRACLHITVLASVNSILYKPEISGINQRRQERLRHLQRAAGRPKFGAVTRIARDQFIGQVTEASRECWVVVHLSQDTCALRCSPDMFPPRLPTCCLPTRS